MSQPVLTIDLDAIAANWRGLSAPGRAKAGAVVKAAAHGLGAERGIPVLVRAGAPAKVPDALDILGPHQGIGELAAAGAIGYEILTALGPRYVRHHSGDPA